MSTQSIDQIIRRVVTEPQFRQMLANDTEQALAGYDLTQEEYNALARIGKYSRRWRKPKVVAVNGWHN